MIISYYFLECEKVLIPVAPKFIHSGHYFAISVMIVQSNSSEPAPWDAAYGALPS